MSDARRKSWEPSLGACCANDGVGFRVWAARRRRVEVVIERSGEEEVYALEPRLDGSFSTFVTGVRAGDRYRYRLDQEMLLPDPASRYQPDGVHGSSQIVDPASFHWTDQQWTGIELNEVVFYELHVGTFSPQGTFDGVRSRLAALVDLGVTAIELMPVADFPGARNWGYDGVALFAPARCYGTPDHLRRLVNAAHAVGLAVILDVVYNHLGPDGAYLGSFSPDYFSARHRTPWGAALNFDGDHSEMVREFFIENACHWVHEYHIDGLRLDATHAIADDSGRHFLAELTARVQDSVSGRRVLIVAEDHRNLNWMLKPEVDGGWGVDAVWADAFHHECRRLLAGDAEGYYRDYSGRTDDLATTIRRGWFYTGQFSAHLGERRGTDSTGLSLHRFVICLQNHDQIGNRALGERLHHQIDLAAYRAATALLLTAPETPLLFMGQEWAARSPFRYFTDHTGELGRLVTKGRRDEFWHFATFSDPVAREHIPDPQAVSTFLESRLTWEDRLVEPHAFVLELYRALLALRRRESALRDARAFRVTALDDSTLAVERTDSHNLLLIVVRLKGAGVIGLELSRMMAQDSQSDSRASELRLLLTTEDAAFAVDSMPPEVEVGLAPAIRFLRPGAIIFKRTVPAASSP